MAQSPATDLLSITTNPSDFGQIGDLHPIYGMSGEHYFSGVSGDYLELGHDSALQTAEATYAMRFTADTVEGKHALFAKDNSGYEQGGHLHVYIDHGVLTIRQQSTDKSEYVKVNDLPIEVGTEYHLAVSFGDNGLLVYLNGQLVAAEPEFKQGMETNTESLVVGASGYRRSDASKPATEEFDGMIADFLIYNTQLAPEQVAAISGEANAADALYALDGEDLMPAFAQLHHASDELEAIAHDFGYHHHGLMGNQTIEKGSDDADQLTGGYASDYINGLLGHDTIDGGGGSDHLQGYYGNDLVRGGDGNDVIDGGHGEDTVEGGAGDDFIISQADGREGFVTYIPFRDEEDPYNELDPVTGKLYPTQPIPADDVLIGGSGADTFYFQTLINAKQRYIEEHTNNDGTIRWHGVAGENDKIHDHWVDVIGHDIIMDFNRDEGDYIMIEGHTTEVLKLEHLDSNGDDLPDYSVLHLYSDQGANGGAHQYDLLGTITVYGDLLRDGDYGSDDDPAYGIVKSIDSLDEAITPIDPGVDSGPVAPPAVTASTDFGVVNGIAPIFGVAGAQHFSGMDGDYLDLAHDRDLMLEAGTIAMHFQADHVMGRQALFGKDASGYADGGHIQAYLEGDKLIVRLQSDMKSYYMKFDGSPIMAGQDYHLSITFGEEGLKGYLNGQLAAAEPEVTQGMATNYENLVIGASGYRRGDADDDAADEFSGTITDFAVYDQDLSPLEIADLAGGEFTQAALHAMALEELMPAFSQLHHASDALRDYAAEFGFGHGTHHDGMAMDMPPMAPIVSGTDGADMLTGTSGIDRINGQMGNDSISGMESNDQLQGGYGNDTLRGGNGDDVLDGGHGEDVIDGGAGDDFLISQADGREGYITYIPFRDEGDPLYELDPVTGKLYPDQPIPADDILIGGEGADTFYFQTLINAKQRYIEEHTNNDGTIRWHGVAGENDKLHDHWVDVIGNDVIWDFSRDEGDKIVIEGHTTEVMEVSWGDINGDGVLDHSVIQLYSDQGANGGAHQYDLLGTITVFGDLVFEGDYMVDDDPAYGIVKTIDKLDEAIEPKDYGVDTGPIAPPEIPTADPSSGVTGYIGGLVLINADTDEVIGDIDNLSTLYLGDLETTNLSIAAVAGPGVDSVVFSLNGGEYTHTENKAPYALFGDSSGDYVGYDWLEGTYQLEATAYSENSGKGAVIGTASISFTVAAGSNPDVSDTEPTDTDYSTEEPTTSDDTALNVVSGTDGADTLNGTQTANVFDAKDGDDRVFGNHSAVGNDTINGGAGNDTIQAYDGDDIIDGGIGNDSIMGMNGNDVIDGGAGNDSLFAGNGDDVMRGGDGVDFMMGNAGSNTLYGGMQDDSVWGGMNGDILYGDNGRDDLRGYAGNDTLYGGDGDDFTLLGHEGNDVIFGDAGADSLHGGIGIDTLYGGTGNDTLTGGGERDVLYGGDGEDLLYGNHHSTGHDTLHGDAGDDTILAYAGDDYLSGGAGIDFLYGLEGNDTLHGGAERDALYSGAGEDVFLFDSTTDSGIGYVNADRIIDFEQGEDKVDLSGMATTFSFVGSGSYGSNGTDAEVRFHDHGATTAIQLDANADGTTDMEIFLIGSYALTADDFIL